MRLAINRALLVALVSMVSGAHSQSLAPLARLNLGFSAATWRVSVDEQEQMVAVGQADNSIAMYSLSQADDRWMISVPVDNEVNRRAHPVTLSPDGSMVAYAIPPKRNADGSSIVGTGSIRIMGPRDQRLLKALQGLPTRAQDIKFSPDGKHLAAVLSGGCGLRLWRTADWEQVFSDDTGYAARAGPDCLKVHESQHDSLPDTHTVVFTPQPARWIVTAGMTGVRAYAQRGQSAVLVVHRLPEQLGIAVPDGIATSPDGLHVVVGDRGTRRVGPFKRLGITVLSLEELSPARRFELADGDLQFPDLVDPAVSAEALQYNLARVAWVKTAHGNWLIGAGSFPCRAAREHLVLRRGSNSRQELCAAMWRWDDPGPAQFIAVGTEQINDVISLRRKGSFIVLSNRRLQAFRTDGTTPQLASSRGREEQVDFRFDSPAVDLRSPGPRPGERLQLLLSQDAQVVHFAEYGLPANGRQPARLTFDIQKLELAQDTDAPPGLAPSPAPDAIAGSGSVWVDQSSPPQFEGGDIEDLQASREIYRAATIAVGGRLALLSSDHLRIIGRSGGRARVLCSMRIQSEGFRITASGDGRWIVIGHGDGVLRWNRLSFSADGRCELEPALSVHFMRASGAAGWAWAAWLPQTGEFVASGNASNPLSWQIPETRCNTATVDFNVLTKALYSREAVAASLLPNRRSGTEGPSLIDRIRSYCDRTQVKVLSPRPKLRIGTGSIDVTLEIADESPISRQLLVELGDRTRLRKKVVGRIYAADEAVALTGATDLRLKVDLPLERMEKDTEFHLCFVIGVSRSCTPLTWGGPQQPSRKRRLWAVLVGASNYGDPLTIGDLRFARNDAVDVARLFIEDQQRATAAGVASEYESVDVQLLVTPQGNGADVDADLKDLMATRWLKVRRPTPDDLRAALQRVAEHAGRSATHDDLVLVHFSGHGQSNAAGQATGSSTLFMPVDLRSATRSVGMVTSGDLADWLAKIQGDKLVILDACRTLPAQASNNGFDPAKVRGELASALPTTHLMFSARPGQPSRESDMHAFDASRGPENSGNGLFSYALLRSLTDPSVDSKLSIKVIGKVTIDEASEYVEQFFFDQAQKSILFTQVPLFVVPQLGPRLVLRKLEARQ